MKTFYDRLKNNADYYDNLFDMYFDDDKNSQIMYNLVSIYVYDGFVMLEFLNHVNMFKEDVNADEEIEQYIKPTVMPHFMYKKYKTVTPEEITNTYKEFCKNDFKEFNVRYLNKEGNVIAHAIFNGLKLEIMNGDFNMKDVPYCQPICKNSYSENGAAYENADYLVPVYMKISYNYFFEEDI